MRKIASPFSMRTTAALFALILVRPLPGQVRSTWREGAGVVASRREMRVSFPAETDSVWWWQRETGMAYRWQVAFGDPPRQTEILLTVNGLTAGVYRSLDSLVRSAQVAECTTGGLCDDRSFERSGRNSVVTIIVRDSAAIARLLWARPTTAEFSTTTPVGGTVGSAVIQYVDPQIPAPDPVRLARSGDPAPAAFHSWEIHRTSEPGMRHEPLWMVVGDSLQVRLLDVGYGGSWSERDVAARWWTADSSVAALSLASSGTAMIRAQKAGTAFVRASPLDTLDPANKRVGMPSVDATIIVTRRIRRLEIVPADTACFAGETCGVFVRTWDEANQLVEGVPVTVSIERPVAMGGTTMQSRISWGGAGWAFQQPGEVFLVARQGPLAGTLTIKVRPRRPPQ